MKKLNKNKYKILLCGSKFIFLFIIAFSFVMPIHAEDCTTLNPNLPKGCTPKKTINTNDANDKTVNTNDANDGVKLNTGIKNPLGDANIPDFKAFLKQIIEFIMLISIPIVTLAIIYSGFLFVTAQGNSEKLTKAKKIFLYTIIGAAIILGAYVIVDVIDNTIKDITETP